MLPLCCFSNAQNVRLRHPLLLLLGFKLRLDVSSAVNGFHMASSLKASVKSSANTPLQVVKASVCSPTSRQPF
ncbi:hypothetical protein ABVT39_012660 [Epinephelus coioides]